jgi:hypothetical protein
MATEDEIIRAYEAEFAPEPQRPSNRGFWLVVGTILAGGLFLIVEIFANRPIANTIGHAQDTLRRAQAAVENIERDTGSFAEADAEGLSAALPGLTFRGGDDASIGLDDVSVWAPPTEWAAAVRAGSDACFYLRLEVGEDPRYGVGGECTGTAALEAEDSRW